MISEVVLLKQLSILLISAIKLMVAAPVSYLLGYSYLHTLANTAAGGLMGVVFFFFLSRTIFRLYRKYSAEVYTYIRTFTGMREKVVVTSEIKSRGKRVFTKRNRLIARIKRSYGMPGIVILTPVLLSIPIGTFLAIKYYSSRRNLLAWLSLSVVLWSAVLTTFIELF